MEETVLKSSSAAFFLGPLGCAEGNRPTLFERSEFVGRPKRSLAALEMDCVISRLSLPLTAGSTLILFNIR